MNVVRSALVLLMVGGAGCAPKPPSKPSGPCTITINATLTWATDAGMESVASSETPVTGLWLQPGQLANLTFYYESAFDFQYQSDIAEGINGMVVRTIVPTTPVQVGTEDKSAFIWDVVPVDTTGLDGLYTVNVGGHVNVNPDAYRCTGPLDQNGNLVISTWRTFGVQVGAGGPPPPPSSSGGVGASSGPGASSGG